MIKFSLRLKIKKELKEFKKFKENSDFKLAELDKKDDGSVFYGNICLRHGEDGEWIGEGENFVNVGYKIHGAMPKALSNLFPYTFYFKGHKLSSIEVAFQSFKFKNAKEQKCLFGYFGLNSNNIKAGSSYDWKQTGKVYFLGKEYDRFGKDYENLIDELYISAIQNPIYRNVLKNVKEKYILHAMGELDNTKTSFTRQEFEKELNILKDFVIYKDKNLK